MSLTGDPGIGFEGRMGRTLADSQPHWRAPRAAAAGSPNVLVIVLDDLGFSDFGCYGGEIETPAIDRLAGAGLRFTGYTTVPMCTPARAALLTGKNPHSVGCGWLTHNNPGFPGYQGGEMSADAPTMPELLREQGYSTLAVGKWHNTYDRHVHAAADRRSWPLQRGFDRFYGFLHAETSYFHPDRMVEGNQLAPVDSYPDGYFATDDYTERLIGWLKEQRTSAPDKPWFGWLAFQAPHTPLHAKPSDLDRQRGRYDAGWDALREARFLRQQAMGLIEHNARLPPRNPGVPAWDELDAARRALYARYMEIYAALVSNVDQNIARLVAFLEQSGQLANTLILITSDNGANSIGGPGGVANLNDRRQGNGEDPLMVQRLLDQELLGGSDTYIAYPTGWTQVSNTPYRYYKRTPMAGGIRVPLIAHWPAGIADRGAVRRQWVHATDLLPTVLELTGGAYPEQFAGYRTRGMNGVSAAALLRDAGAISGRTHQHYELEGNRGYIRDGWKIVSLQPPGSRIDLENWMLFDLAADPTEIVDLAREHPGRLRSMIEAFESDARANYVYPLDNRDTGRAITLPPHELADAHRPRDFYPDAPPAPGVIVSPMICDRSVTLTARFDWRCGDAGVIVAMGDRFTGLLAYVDEGALQVVWQRWMNPLELAPIALAAGPQVFTLEFSAIGQRQGRGRFVINGAVAIEAADLSPTPIRLPSGGLDVGINRRQAISDRIAGRGGFRYSGRIEGVRIVPGPQAPGSPIVFDEAQAQARLRGDRA